MVDLGQNVASKVPSGFFVDVCCRLHKMKQCLEFEMIFLASTKCLLLGLNFFRWGLWISFNISGCMAFGIMIFSPLKRMPFLNDICSQTDQYGKQWVRTIDLWSAYIAFLSYRINCCKSKSGWVIDWSWSSLDFDIGSVDTIFTSNSNDVWLSDWSGK